MNPGSREDTAIHALRLWKGSGKRIFFCVETGSMSPMIRPGDSVEIKMVNPDRIRPGDLIGYLQNGRVMVHRLLKVERGANGLRFWEQGDALSGWVCLDQEVFLGRVETIQRGRDWLDMKEGPWPWINWALGFAGRTKIGLMESACRVRRGTMGERPVPVLREMGKAFRAMMGMLERLLIAAALLWRGSPDDDHGVSPTSIQGRRSIRGTGEKP